MTEMTDITIPPAALEAAKAAYLTELETGTDPLSAACLAMLKAWPGQCTLKSEKWNRTTIILPLQQEPNNDAG